ncbi:AfsA-related hotdog domain-containing protein [Nocardiopsis trehalosi]|jgi:hypothetical protein|uniref:AfsA-related hotdog domain-containing protein n=1 Tax=Nocardiopsis trehalosi TaxID=109329 RepID=UPI000829B40F|nr:AfsA-related hotdog domain-containing protein [Nocardiopsis trehalosi]
MEILTRPGAAEATGGPAPMLDLDYDRTVSRAIVHRWAVAEVFLTDSRAVDETRFAAAAQLPPAHHYFGDHTGLPDAYDPLLVLESCRHAVTHACHVHQDLPDATAFMVTAWTLEVRDPGALAIGERPGRLYIDGEVTDRRRRGGRLRRLVFALELRLDGRPFGRVTMDVACTPGDQYRALRAMQRGPAGLPTAFTLPAEPAGPPVDPAAVHRRVPVNVVVDGAEHAGDGVRAVLSPRSFRNRTLYDHPYDHVPGMVFTEAARQLAALLAPGSARPLLGVDAAFLKFAELDAPVELSCARGTGGGYRMTAVQSGAAVAEITLTLG